MKIRGKLGENFGNQVATIEPDKVQSVSVGDIVLARVRVCKVEGNSLLINNLSYYGDPLTWVNIIDLVSPEPEQEPERKTRMGNKTCAKILSIIPYACLKGTVYEDDYNREEIAEAIRNAIELLEQKPEPEPSTGIEDVKTFGDGIRAGYDEGFEIGKGIGKNEKFMLMVKLIAGKDAEIEMLKTELNAISKSTGGRVR